MEARPMVTIITDMTGSPIRRRKKIRSTLMARKKVTVILIRNEKTMGISPQTVRAKAMNAPEAMIWPWAKFATRLDL